MKKIFKSRIFAFILGAFIFSGITAVSAYTILANDIGYTPKDTTWKKSNGEDITNVKEALDELYTRSNLTEMVWINPNLNATLFEPTTINVDLSKYDSILVLGKYSSYYGTDTGYVRIDKNTTGVLQISRSVDNIISQRRITVNNDNIIIENGYASDDSSSNYKYYSLPMYIIGVKTKN